MVENPTGEEAGHRAVGDYVETQACAFEKSPTRPIMPITANEDARTRLLLKPPLGGALDIVGGRGEPGAAGLVHADWRQVTRGIEG